MKKTALNLIAFGFLLFLFFTTGCSLFYESQEVSAKEREALITVRDFEAFGYNFERLDTGEKFNKVTYFGLTDLEYEAFFEDDYSALYISHTLSKDQSKLEAGKSFTAEGLGMKVGELSGLELEEIGGFYSYGDESVFSRCLYEGVIAGNSFRFRKDKYLFSLLFTGFYFDDPVQFADWIKPKIDRFEAIKEEI